MVLFGPSQLASMRRTQERHMQDTCLIAEPSSTTNTYNLKAEAWSWGALSDQICGFEANPKPEVLNQVPTSDAVIRLPIGTVISNHARVRITKRFAEAVTPITYEVVGLPKQGPSGLRVWLKKVTDGS